MEGKAIWRTVAEAAIRRGVQTIGLMALGVLTDVGLLDGGAAQALRVALGW